MDITIAMKEKARFTDKYFQYTGCDSIEQMVTENLERLGLDKAKCGAVSKLID